MEGLASLLPLVGIALIFYLLIIRPASRRQKDLSRMQSDLSLGDAVVLTSGIYGTISAFEDDALRLTLAEGVTVKVARAAVGSVVQDGADEGADEGADQPGAADPEETS